MDNPVTQGKRRARELRKELRLSPTQRIDPMAIAKALGVVLVGRPLRARQVAGAYLYRSSTDCSFIMFNTSEKLLRQRFTVCHELGHFFFDKKTSIVEELPASAADLPPIEKRANAFAAELLLPEAGIKAYNALEEWRTSPKQVAELALSYGSSYVATLWALCNANRINKEDVSSLTQRFKELSAETRETFLQPGRENFEIPSTFEDSLLRAHESKAISTRRVAELRRLISETLAF